MSGTAAEKQNRRGVLICGAYGHGNAGDDAILDAMLAEIRAIDPDMPITVMSRSPEETRAKTGAESIYIFDIRSFHRAMAGCRLYINGGGSLIQDVTSRRSLLFYLYTLRAAKKRGCRVMMYGCGIGPVTRSGDVGLTRRVLNKYVDLITLREPHSLRELERFGVTEPETVLAADPALALPAAPEEEIGRIMARAGLEPGGRYICFALREWPGLEAAAPAIAAGAEHAWRQLGLEPVFLSINHRSDGRAADRVAARLGQAPVHILREPLDHAGAIGLMSRMEAVVSMRLHGLIFALGAAAPSVGISYDPKVTAFLDYIGCPLHAPLEELTAEGLCGLIDRAVAMADDREGLRRTAARLREMCAVNARCAAQLLRQD